MEGFPGNRSLGDYVSGQSCMCIFAPMQLQKCRHLSACPERPIISTQMRKHPLTLSAWCLLLISACLLNCHWQCTGYAMRIGQEPPTQSEPSLRTWERSIPPPRVWAKSSQSRFLAVTLRQVQSTELIASDYSASNWINILLFHYIYI